MLFNQKSPVQAIPGPSGGDKRTDRRTLRIRDQIGLGAGRVESSSHILYTFPVFQSKFFQDTNRVNSEIRFQLLRKCDTAQHFLLVVQPNVKWSCGSLSEPLCLIVTHNPSTDWQHLNFYSTSRLMIHLLSSSFSKVKRSKFPIGLKTYWSPWISLDILTKVCADMLGCP